VPCLGVLLSTLKCLSLVKSFREVSEPFPEVPHRSLYHGLTIRRRVAKKNEEDLEVYQPRIRLRDLPESVPYCFQTPYTSL
jgi:hypothetical protein